MDLWVIFLIVSAVFAVGFFAGYRYGLNRATKALKTLYEAFGKMYADVLDKEDSDD